MAAAARLRPLQKREGPSSSSRAGDEELWIQHFDVVNEIFTMAPVVVTLVVMFLHYREVDFASKMVKLLRAPAG